MSWRKLKHNKATQIARNLFFVDTETQTTTPNEKNLGPNKLTFGVVRRGKFINAHGKTVWGRTDSTVFRTSDEFWAYIQQHSRIKETTWIYAHNAAFDFVILGLLNRLDNGELEISKPRKRRNKKTGKTEIHGLLLVDGPPTVIGLEDATGQRYVLCDTLNYWRTSLASLGRELNFEKLKYPAKNDSDTIWERYCNQDAAIIEKAVVDLITWWRDNDLGNWRWTAPGLAMSAFRHRFMSHDIVFHDEKPVRKLERESYFGGQLEAFYVGDIHEPIWQYDVVSLYPSVMHGNLYPVKLLDYDVSAELSTVPPITEPDFAIAEVEIDTGDDTFPLRTKDNVSYCRGRGIVTLAGPELSYAYRTGFVRRWGRWATYAMEPIFDEYVTFFSQLKEQYSREGKEVQRSFVKMLLNSLYGKFGQYGGSWTVNPDRMPLHGVGIFKESNWITGEETRCLALGNVVLDWTPTQEIDMASPAIASFVTSYARQRMREIRAIAGRGNYYYMATDSLMVNQTGNDHLTREAGLIGNQLGQLKLEKQAESAWIGGLHWYRLGDKLVEGSKKSSATTIDLTTWRELQFENLVSVVKRARHDPDNMDAIVISEIEKHRTKEYDKGRVGTDGWVTPYTFSELSK